MHPGQYLILYFDLIIIISCIYSPYLHCSDFIYWWLTSFILVLLIFVVSFYVCVYIYRYTHSLFIYSCIFFSFNDFFFVNYSLSDHRYVYLIIFIEQSWCKHALHSSFTWAHVQVYGIDTNGIDSIMTMLKNAHMGRGARFPEKSTKDHWPMVPQVMRNGPGQPSTKKSWSHACWEMVPTHIQISTPIHRFIDRSICHGRYRHRPSIHPREIQSILASTINSPTKNYGRSLIVD